MVIVVGQASFLLHISYEILPILKGIRVLENHNKMRQVSFHIKKNMKYCM